MAEGRGQLLFACVLFLLLAAAAAAGCGTKTAAPASSPAVVDPRELDFGAPPTPDDAAAYEVMDRYLHHLVAENWAAAWELLDPRVQERFTREQFAAQSASPQSAAILEYRITGVRTVPQDTQHAVAQIELRVRSQRSIETWVEYWRLARVGTEWRIADAPRI
ncbi:MAG: hypothetical protein Kow00122_21300 [Thermoleophilia bacterium]